MAKLSATADPPTRPRSTRPATERPCARPSAPCRTLAWRSENQAALVRGALRAPSRTTLAEAAEEWAHSGGGGRRPQAFGRPYKPLPSAPTSRRCEGSSSRPSRRRVRAPAHRSPPAQPEAHGPSRTSCGHSLRSAGETGLQLREARRREAWPRRESASPRAKRMTAEKDYTSDRQPSSAPPRSESGSLASAAAACVVSMPLISRTLASCRCASSTTWSAGG